MWTGLATLESCLPVQPPFSFFFDLVASYWKSDKTPSLTLHRICTLARKQGARFIIVESALTRPDIQEEINFLDDALGGGGAAEAVAISFLASEREPTDLSALSVSDVLGQVVLINYRAPGSTEFTHTYLYEAILTPPALRNGQGVPRQLLNNFICAEGEFLRNIKTREFQLRGIYYCQQNETTHVCAHACLRMALNSIRACDPPISSRVINANLGITPPFSGLSLGQIANVIDGTPGAKASVVPCDNLPLSNFLIILAAIVESGHVALLVFTTGNPQIEHVVTVFGYTRNSDEWHPEAVPAYAGGPPSTPYYPSSFWIDHFLIHDDNFGPYYSFSSRALDFDQKVKARHIIALHPVCPIVRPDYAEGVAAITLLNLLPSLAPIPGGRWFEFITRNPLKFVLRTILIDKRKYLDHVSAARDHDGASLTVSDIELLKDLPEWFWMVEFSLPALYTGNRSKLGEILVDGFAQPNPSDVSASLIALRLPGLLISRGASGQMISQQISVHSHSPIFQHRHHDDVW
jgi:hypothetical protein